jgi:endonuclease YncB( thermonuclease family)
MKWAHIGTTLIAVLSGTAAVADLSCKVVGVSDGDTITALCQSREQVKVRLAEIDAPEKAQPFGAKSKQSLSDLCFGKTAQIVEQDRDRYGRTVARVRCAGIDANAEQVRRGFAWVYDRYVTDQDLYLLQDTARAERRGLWADNNPTPPWEWRKARR